MFYSHYVKIALSHLCINKREITTKLRIPEGCVVSRNADKTKCFIDFCLTLKSSTTKDSCYIFWKVLDEQGEVFH